MARKRLAFDELRRAAMANMIEVESLRLQLVAGSILELERCGEGFKEAVVEGETLGFASKSSRPLSSTFRSRVEVCGEVTTEYTGAFAEASCGATSALEEAFAYAAGEAADVFEEAVVQAESLGFACKSARPPGSTFRSSRGFCGEVTKEYTGGGGFCVCCWSKRGCLQGGGCARRDFGICSQIVKATELNLQVKPSCLWRGRERVHRCGCGGVWRGCF